MSYVVLSYDDYLYHHGVKGMKWGVRRYQNADGSLTAAGKKRQARIDKSDETYRKRQMTKTANYYDRDRRTGPFGIRKQDGINSLQRKLDSQSNRYDKNVIRGQLEHKKILKQYELKKISQLDHDGIMKERTAVGKSVAKDLLISMGASAVLLPTTGMVYGQYHSSQDVRSNMRRSGLRYERED